MTSKRWHIVPRGSKWGIRREGTGRDSIQTNTKAEAEQRVREIVNNQGGGEVIPHGRDGKIQNPDTIKGHDPCPPKDQKH